MARKIKFRMWNFSKMVYRGIYDKNWYFHPTKCELHRSINQAYHIFPLMQFTGLQDKNGKDIYEGDIVKSYVQGEEKYSIDIIKDIRDCKILESGAAFDNSWLVFEIIGNIHEHPELLGDGNESSD